MPDLRKTRKNIQIALGVLIGVDVVAATVFFSPLVGSTESRRLQLNELWSELQTKTRLVEPLADLPKKVNIAREQITDFYKKRFPTQDSEIAVQIGKLALASGVTIDSIKYKAGEDEIGQLEPVELEADLSGNYVSLAKFINALERDDTLFVINGIELGGEQTGPIKLQMKLETYLKART